MADSNSTTAMGLEYWLQWQVFVCALIIILPTAIAVKLLRNSGAGGISLKSADLWAPCWRNLHPQWLLFYRAFTFAAMAFFLYQTVASLDLFVFFFYTQWTFTLVMIYFGIATIVSARGCSIYSSKPLDRNGERNNILKKNMEEINHEKTVTYEKEVGFLENVLQVIYQTCAGAIVLTDIVFWCLLLPFMTGENFKLTVLIGCMHSVNAVFLVIESLLNRMPFPWFGIVYFVFWSCSYVVFQWTVHACCVSWWPYPFLDLSTPSAPLWYLALALVHIPCYGLYVWLMKGKDSVLSRLFPNSYIRVSTNKKQA